MNLQLLTYAASLTGNATYLSMATSHANKTLLNNIRSDFSSFHLVDYSPTTGAVQRRGTAQGELDGDLVASRTRRTDPPYHRQATQTLRETHSAPCKAPKLLTHIPDLVRRTWSRGQAWGIYGLGEMNPICTGMRSEN